jgi:hypothetical protein
MYALPQYLERVSEIMDDIAAGADPRSAISAGFTGTLLSAVMRKLKMNSPTREEIQGIGSMVYTPVAKRNPASRPKESPLYVKYLSLMSGEEPFMMQGTKYEYVWAEYPGGIKDIGVYSYANDLVYSYDSFRQMMNLDRTNPASRNAMNSEGLHFIWVLEKDRRAYLHVYKSLQKATTALNTFSKIKRGAIDPSIGRIGSRGISQLGHGIGNSKMTIDDIASKVEKKYGAKPEVIRHDLDDGDTNPVHSRNPKQRIAVCLSKSRKRNPVYDTGSDE